MYVLRKIQGDLNKVVCDVQCHWNGEHYVDIPKDILTQAQAYIEIDVDTDTPRTIVYYIYKHKNKGYYVKIRGKRVYLNTLENYNNIIKGLNNES